MGDLSVSAIGPIDVYKIRQVLASPNITESQKVQFLKTNNMEIKAAFKSVMSSDEYNMLMANRPLQKFKPIKNSFTKKGDRQLLAKAMEIPVSQLDNTIAKTVTDMKEIGNLDFLSQDKIRLMQTYVYRHGSKDQVVAFLDYELSHAKDITQSLYSTFDYHTGGMADYFVRPIHRMDNQTLVNVYNVVDKNLEKAKQNGSLNDAEALELSEWALRKIYLIQNNSKVINAIKTYNELK